MTAVNPGYVGVGAVDDFAPDSLRVVRVEGLEVVIARLGDDFHAFTNYCPHDELALVGGYIAGCAFVCPHHGAAFDYETGETLREPAYGPLAVYRVRVVDGELQVESRPANLETPTRVFTNRRPGGQAG